MTGVLSAVQEGQAGQTRQTRCVALYLRERWDRTAIAFRDDVVERTWVRTKGVDSKADVIVGVYCQPPHPGQCHGRAAL